QGQVSISQLENQVLALLAEGVLLLAALDHRSAMMRVDDLVSDVKRHTSPRDQWSGGKPKDTGYPEHRPTRGTSRAIRSPTMVEPSLLGRPELFRGLAPESLAEIAAASVTRTLTRGDVLFRQGEPADELYVVQQGRLAIVTQSPDGRASMVALLEPGDLFGE